MWLQAYRSGFLDALATLLHFLGLNLVIAGIIVLIYWRVDKRLGIRLLIALVLAIVLTDLLKNVFHTPRPFQAHPDLVTPLIPQLNYGIPSGHVLTAVWIWGYTALRLNQIKRRRWLYGLASVYVLLMAWSRMYTGVHYPQDVIAGLVFGLLAVWLYWRVTKSYEG